MIVIDTSVWILIINHNTHSKAAKGRTLLSNHEEIGIPGIILDEILRGFRDDDQHDRVRRYLMEDFIYLEMTRDVFLFSAEIYRTLRKKGITLSNPADCLIASAAIIHQAFLLENDADFKIITRYFPLHLVS